MPEERNKGKLSALLSAALLGHHRLPEEESEVSRVKSVPNREQKGSINHCCLYHHIHRLCARGKWHSFIHWVD